VPRVEHEPAADLPPVPEPTAAGADEPGAPRPDAVVAAVAPVDEPAADSLAAEEPAADVVPAEEHDDARRDDAGERAAELAGLVDELEQLEADLEALATEVAAVDATRDLR
jgi:hypothetical protein